VFRKLSKSYKPALYLQKPHLRLRPWSGDQSEINNSLWKLDTFFTQKNAPTWHHYPLLMATNIHSTTTSRQTHWLVLHQGGYAIQSGTYKFNTAEMCSIMVLPLSSMWGRLPSQKILHILHKSCFSNRCFNDLQRWKPNWRRPGQHMASRWSGQGRRIAVTSASCRNRPPLTMRSNEQMTLYSYVHPVRDTVSVVSEAVFASHPLVDMINTNRIKEKQKYNQRAFHKLINFQEEKWVESGVTLCYRRGRG